MKLTAKHTIAAGYIGYMTQALSINFAPLLFITFEESFGISLGKISLLIAISFITQLTIDGLAAEFSNHLNTRAVTVAGHLCSAAGMILFSFLPSILPDPFIGLVIPTVLAAVGGGIIEVLISPIVEACPTKEKSSAMSLLHSFYSWGSVATVFLSTLFFSTAGIGNWRILAALWSIVPLTGAVMFSLVPIYELKAEENSSDGKHSRSLLRSGIFWIFFLMMFCSGASEMAMAQWASSFAETGLGVTKALGDLLGPGMFAVCMGSTRVFYAMMSKRIKLPVFFALSAAFCAIAYLIAALSPLPLISLLGCALCGLSVGIMWPGTYSLATVAIPYGGVRMFALLALAGDLGCTVGPSVTGFVADIAGDNLKTAFICSVIFPAVMLALIPFIVIYMKKQKGKQNNGTPRTQKAN